MHDQTDRQNGDAQRRPCALPKEAAKARGAKKGSGDFSRNFFIALCPDPDNNPAEKCTSTDELSGADAPILGVQTGNEKFKHKVFLPQDA
jgi:hypothetical protein